MVNPDFTLQILNYQFADHALQVLKL
jgi:hypothetical protein